MEGYYSIIQLKTTKPATPAVIQHMADFITHDLRKCTMSTRMVSLAPIGTPAGKPTKLRVEFDHERGQALFEKIYFKRTQQEKEALHFRVLPLCKPTSILLTQVPGKWDEKTLLENLFGPHHFAEVLSFIREEKKLSNGSTYYTGRAWFNFTRKSFDLETRHSNKTLPTKIKVVKDWYINVHASKKQGKNKPKNDPPCKQSGTEVQPTQQSKADQASEQPKMFPTKRQRTYSDVSSKTTLSKTTIKSDLDQPQHPASKLFRNTWRRHLEQQEKLYSDGKLTTYSARHIIKIFKDAIERSKKGGLTTEDDINFFKKQRLDLFI